MTSLATWRSLPFDELFRDVTGGNPRVEQRHYQESGILPVVDQGQAAIAGFVNDPLLACRTPLPCLVFGDHTRIVKYVDHSFAIGAQGVKVLVPIPEVDPRFAYYALQRVRFPADTGYSRHSRFLKRIRIAFPPLPDQRRIAAVLDNADGIRRKRRESLRLLDELLRSAFLEIFGDPVRNEKGWEVVRLEDVLNQPLRNGLSPSKGGGVVAQVLTLTAITGSRYEPTAVKTGYFAHAAAPDQIAGPEDFLICRGNGNLRLMGRGRFPRGVTANTVFPDTMIAARVDQSRVEPSYLEAVWGMPLVRRALERGARTTSGIHKVNQRVLVSTRFPLPAIKEQKRYAQVAGRVVRLRERLSDDTADNLFDSLAQRAFRGEL